MPRAHARRSLDERGAAKRPARPHAFAIEARRWFGEASAGTFAVDRMGEGGTRVVLVIARRDELVVADATLPSGLVEPGERIRDAARRIARGIGAEIAGLELSFFAARPEGVVVGVVTQLASDPASLVGASLRPRGEALSRLSREEAAIATSERSGMVAFDGEEALPIAWGSGRGVERLSAAPAPVVSALSGTSARARFGAFVLASCLAGATYAWVFGVVGGVARVVSDREAKVGGISAALLAWVLATWFGYRDRPAKWSGFAWRAAGTLFGGGLLFVMMMAIFSGPMRLSDRDSFFFATIVGIVGLFAARRAIARPRATDTVVRIAFAAAWLTAAFVTVWSMSSGFRHLVRVEPHVISQDDD